MSINTQQYYFIQNSINQSSQKSELMIVSKNRSVEDISNFINLGHCHFGENRIQEAKKKFIDTAMTNSKRIKLSLIGPLQSNKTSLALEIFDSIHSIDRIKIIDEIAKYIDRKNTKTTEFFIQINIGLELQKSGIHPKDLKDLFLYAKNKSLKISGLMCIPPNDQNPQKYFSEMVSLRNSLDSQLALSMGMSHDYQIALDCGSNIIRVGSLLFND